MLIRAKHYLLHDRYLRQWPRKSPQSHKTSAVSDACTSMQRRVQNEPSCMIPLLLQNNNAAADFSSQEVFAGIVANSFKKSRGSASEVKPNKSEKMARMSILTVAPVVAA